MSDYIQNLNSLASVTSLSQLKMDGEGQLEKRNALSTLGHRIADAFRSLSAEGRTAIAARNVELLFAMQKAVNESTHHEVFPAREAGDRLEAALGRLQQKTPADTNAYFIHLRKGITDDPRFKALPERLQKNLLGGLPGLKRTAPADQWKSRFSVFAGYFYGETPAAFDLQKGVEEFQKQLVFGEDDFLTVAQQGKVRENGIHDSFYLDTNRRSIKSFNGAPTPDAGPECTQHCEEKLRAMLGEQRKDILPFVSMMASQAGMESAKNFLPGLCGMGETNFQNLHDAGLVPLKNPVHDIHISSDGDTLTIRNDFKDRFASWDDYDTGTPSLTWRGTISMVIDLKADPDVVRAMNGNDVYVPKFHLADASVIMERSAT